MASLSTWASVFFVALMLPQGAEAAAKCSTKFELFGGTTSSFTQCADKETLSSGDCKADPCTDADDQASCCVTPVAAAKCSTKFELFGGTTSSLTQCADKETLSSGDCKTDPCTDADDKASCCVTPVAATTTAAPTTAAPTTAATAKTASSTNKASLGGTVMFALVALAAYKN